MNYPLYIARRLSLSSAGNRTAPAIAVAITAVALSIAVMLASVAVVTGFKKQIRDKVVGFNGHLTVYAADINGEPGNRLLSLSPELLEIVEEEPFVNGQQLGISVPAVLKTPDEFKGIYIKSLTDSASLEFLKDNIQAGVLPDFNDGENRNELAISATAASELGLNPGDKIDTYFIADEIRVRRLHVAAVYNTPFNQYDDVMAFGSPGLIQGIAGLDANQGTFLSVRVDDFDKIGQYAHTLQDHLDDGLLDGRLKERYYVDTVLNQGAGFFNWLSLLDTNVAVILTLMMIVGSFTLVSGMLIIILEKKRFIGMIKALGAPTVKVRQVFVWLALRIAVIGLLIGNILTIALLWVQKTTHFLRLDPDAYYIDFVPVELSWPVVIGLNAGVLAVTYLVLILPSRFVAGISPAETMRYE